MNLFVNLFVKGYRSNLLEFLQQKCISWLETDMIVKYQWMQYFILILTKLIESINFAL